MANHGQPLASRGDGALLEKNENSLLVNVLFICSVCLTMLTNISVVWNCLLGATLDETPRILSSRRDFQECL